MSKLILIGLGITAIGLAGRSILRGGPRYYKGGFDPKMTRREAGLILGVSPSSDKSRIKEAHRRMMLRNHPDNGGSPYIAAKINQAKDIMDDNKR